MSFRGKVVEKKTVDLGGMKVEMTTTEYNNFPRRKKVVWWMGEMKIVELGELITIYHAGIRKSEFEEIKWEPLYYKVKLNESADAEEAILMYFSSEDAEEGWEDGFDFDDLDEANEFIRLLKCKSITAGGIEIDSRAEFNRWVKVLEIAEEERKKREEE